MIDILTIIFWSGTVFTVVARLMNIKRIWYCFLFWIVGTIIMLYQGFYLKQWNIVAYQIVYLTLNFYGLFEWYKLDRKRKLKC